MIGPMTQSVVIGLLRAAHVRNGTPITITGLQFITGSSSVEDFIWCMNRQHGFNFTLSIQAPGHKCNKWAGSMLMFHADVNMKRLGIHFKNDSLNDSESTLSFERQ